MADLRVLPCLLFAAVSLAAQAPVTVDPVFGDHMVLQRDQPVRIWGEAQPGAAVTVQLAERDAESTADLGGAWSVELAPLPAGGPHTVRVSSGGETVELEDVLLGEVWLCAGQSNMWWPLSRSESASIAIASADVPGLRLFDMQGVGNPGDVVWDAATLARCTPELYYGNPEWRVSTPETARDISAVAWFFGRELHERLGVPVGIIHNAIGGTCIEAYISREGLRSNGRLAGAALETTSWLDNPIVPAWPRTRARKNLSRWLGQPVGPMPGHPFQPSFLFEAGIRPLTPLGLRGAVWYQGESNATLPDNRTPADPNLCRAGIETLIADWRRAFRQPELPFLYVQLPGMGREWMEFREVQRQCLAVPRTSMAVTIDIGHPTDVHPRNKREVARRLALLAQADVYGQDVRGGRGPRVASWESLDGAAVITFSEVADGLATRDEQPPTDLELVGADGVWHPAEAQILGDSVRVTSPRVPEPLAVRYAWAPVPNANLVGGTGLPVSPFVEGRVPRPPTESSTARVAPPLAATGFEGAPAGPFTALATDAGQWSAERGHASVDPAHRRSGRQCLHLVGGDERQVVLVPETGGAEVSEVSFWAERWTRREPFEFRVEALSGGAWREVYRGDDEIVIGTFKTAVRVEIHGPLEALRMTCTSVAGVLIDDLRLGLHAPMEIVSVTTEQPVAPCLVANEVNPVALVRIETRGALQPLEVTELDVDLKGTTDLGDVADVAILGAEGQTLGDPQPPSETLTFRGRLPLREGTNTLTISMRLAAEADIDHVVDAACNRVRISNGGDLSPAVTAPPVAQRLGVDLRDAGDDGAAVYRIPAITTTNAGTLLAAYDVRWSGWGDLPGDIDVGLSRSTDGGRTWEPMRIVLDMGDDPAFRRDGVGDPAILVDEETGSVWIAAVWSHGDRGWHGSSPGLTPDETGQLVLTRSDDDGRTWSEPLRITEQVKRPEWSFLLQGPGRGISMRDGTLVFAAQYQESPEESRTPHSTILYSRDHGATWELGNGVRPNTTEAQVVELEDGVLMLNLRDNRGGTRSVFTTSDLGRTWQEHPTSRRDLVGPVCNAALLRTAGDVLLFVNPAVDAPPRRRMTIRASTDLGRTWPGTSRLLLDEGRSAGYPSLTWIDEDTVGVLFEGSRAQLTFVRVRLDELVR